MDSSACQLYNRDRLFRRCPDSARRLLYNSASGVALAHLYYMSLPNVGRWDKAMKDAGAQFKPFLDYLHTAKRAAMNRRPTLSWRAATVAEATRFEERVRRRYEERDRRALGAQRRRERHVTPSLNKGVWIVLGAPPWRSEEPEDTFEAFFDVRAEVHDRPPGPRDRGSPVLDFDREGLAILLDAIPTTIDPDPDAEPSEPGKPVFEGALLFIKPNTHTLDCQLRALNNLDSRPAPRLGPLLRLAVADATWDEVDSVDIDEHQWLFLDKPDRDGTDEQREFVVRALGTPDFAILEGPPGSGKTTAICELIAQLAMDGKRILLVASTHVAVDNVLERMLERQESLLDKLVLPVRIGDENNVASEFVKPWVYRRLQQTWRDEIQDFLDDPQGGSAMGEGARSILLQALAKKGSGEESPLLRLLLDSSNLVCGTTIGILQHPAIRAAHQTPFEPFDVLILDEASKTPFAEFLVPALHARKWIVVGDVRQLSPYVEEQDLAENLSGLLNVDAADAAAYAFLASGLCSHRTPGLVASRGPEMSTRLAEEATARDVRFVDLDLCDPAEPEYGLLHADLVFGSPDAIHRFQHRLPAEVEVTGGPLPELPAWEATRRALTAAKVINPTDEPVDWAGEVAWRLVRSYELRQNPQERDRYVREIDGLFPQSLSPEDRAGLTRSLDTVRRVAMPSVLELLQRGFERLPGKPDFRVVLTDGLPVHVLKPRLVALSYQHRMHPDISRFPREHFYGVSATRGAYLTDPNDAELAALLMDFVPWEGGRSSIGTKDFRSVAALLQDASTMEADRQWDYPRYPSGRAGWLHVAPDRRRAGGNRNAAEARRVIGELSEFARWGQDHPNRDREGRTLPWEVAVLTFYRGQEALLREELQRISQTPGNTRNFQLPTGVPMERRLIHVTLCTVDRFQGHEADFVLLSFVKSGTVGFLNSPNRLNVALTRARYQIMLVGDREYFRSDRCRSPLLGALGNCPHYPADLTWESSP